jgi:hypothetical protein
MRQTGTGDDIGLTAEARAEHWMAGRFFDELLYWVMSLDIEKRSSHPHGAKVTLQDRSCSLRVDLLSTKHLGPSSPPERYLRLGTHIVDPGHGSIR